jgi:pyridoxal phosphate enzyme (YggS family)
VRIVGACKGVDDEAARRAVDAGIVELGVNRAQELRARAEALPSSVAWHYIGSVQTNKVPLLSGVALIHGLYRIREAEALQAACERDDRTQEVLLQVNIAGEGSKQGADPAGLDALVEGLQACPRLRARGFMFVAPQAENPEDVRWVFTEGKRLRERYEGSDLIELSMGMTDDYEVAIEEGATIVRIGRAIFHPATT